MRAVAPSAAVLALLAALLASAPPAPAHGPCRCTWPAVAEPGGEVRSASGYKAVWNPRPRDFADQTTPEELASGHRVDAPTVTFVQGTAARPRRRMRVRVPRATPPGIYLILVYDGSEGGAHTTWDYVQVPGAPATTAPTDQAATHPAEPPSRTGALQIALLVLVVLAAVLLTTRIGTRRARRARQAG